MKLKELFSIILEKADNYMSNSCNKTSTLSNTAEIVKAGNSVYLNPLRWSSFEQWISSSVKSNLHG
jgi:hypothetical protein